MATGDILAVRIASAASHNGWVAEIDVENLAVGGTYATGFSSASDTNPVNAKVVFTVTSPGYDATGASGNIVRTVYGVPCWSPNATGGLRKAYPNQTEADENVVSTTLTIRLALTDFIYTGDTATVAIASGLYTQGSATAAFSGSVTNNSTLAHPKIIGRWLTIPYQRMTGNFVLEALCVHRSAMNGKPVACVIFEATDGTNTVTQTVTDMTVSTEMTGAGAAAALKVLTYAATINVSTLTQGATITCNFKAYPWVGNSGATLDSRTSADGFTQPDERLGPLELLLDKTAAYAGGVAVVDATNGQASTATTWVYANQATAESTYGGGTTNSYNTIGRAVQAIKAYNNANLSRDNPGGGTILISGVGTINWPGTTPGVNQGAQQTWLTIKRLSTVSRATAVITADSVNDLETQRVKFEDVTLFCATGTFRLSGDDAAVDCLWVDNCTVDLNTTGGTAPIVFWKVCYGTRNTVTAITNGFIGAGSGARAPWKVFRGNVGPAGTGPAGRHTINATMYTFVGNYNLRPTFQATGNSAGHQISDNTIIAFNACYANSNAWMVYSGGTVITHGNAFIQNILEQVATTDWVAELSEDGIALNHSVVWHNIFAGSRMGWHSWTVNNFALYLNFSFRGNLYEEYAAKTDVTSTANAIRTGNWPVCYQVGSVADFRLDPAGQILPAFRGLYGVDGGTWAFVDNAASNPTTGGGDDSGNGDYHMLASHSAYALMPGGVYSALPYDLEGTARKVLTAGGSAGAFEMNSPAESVVVRPRYIGL
jgi:hypothetical protein